ncbi:MAG: Lrp/AsnC family transcriptional regulator [Thiobacillaceae bacterium]
MSAPVYNPLSDLEFRLLNDWQRDFPLVSRPYAELAARLGSDETRVLRCLAGLKARGYVSRIGAVFRPHVLGSSTLAALACPADRLEEVARVIDALPEVNHNYEREHAYNLWFVVTAPTREQVAQVLAEVHRRTGLAPLDLPMLADYHIDLGFNLQPGTTTEGAEVAQALRSPHQDAAGSLAHAAALRAQMQSDDYALAAALEDGLPLTPRPYTRLAARCGASEAEVLARIERLLALSVIRRFGVVVRHRELGYTANAMVVWDIPSPQVDRAGRLLAAQPAVTLCYQRPRRLPEWPYNLFSMVHGRDRAAVLAQVSRLQEMLRNALGLPDVSGQPLFSRRRFKQCGARYSTLARAA